MTMHINYWGDLGGRPLTAEEIDQNFHSFADALADLQGGLSGKGIDRIEQDPDAGTVTVYLTDGTYDGPFPLPARPINPRGPRVVGAQYLPSDLVTDSGSAYLVLRAHAASADVATDVASGAVMLLVAHGRDAVTYRGSYDASVPYDVGDLVTVQFDPSNQLVFDGYQLMAAAPAGTDPTRGYPWARLTPRPARGIEREIQGKPVAGQVVRYLVNGASPSGGLYVPKAATGSNAVLGGPPAAAYSIAINKRAGGPGGTLTAIGTITWAAGAVAGTFNVAASAFLAPGDVVEFVCPATPDANAAALLVNMAVY